MKRVAYASKAAKFRRLLRKDKTGCMFLAGSQRRDVYRVLSWEGQAEPAHRAAWEVEYGRPAPADRMVCHTCDVPACVNVRHLFLGTGRDNLRDAAAKGKLSNKGPRRKRRCRLSFRRVSCLVTLETLAELRVEARRREGNGNHLIRLVIERAIYDHLDKLRAARGEPPIHA